MSTKSFVLSMLAGAGLLVSCAVAQEGDAGAAVTPCATITSSGTTNAGVLAAFTGPCAIGPASRAGIGTEHPHSPLEVKGQIGTSNTNSVTITNTGTAGAAAEAAVDFNTYVPFSSGTYNPSGRFTAVDDGQFGNGFEWLSNLPSTQGGGFYNSGLFTLLSWLILDHAQVPQVGGRPRPRATPGRASSIIIEF
jgi:hypothetical protein